jgi:hypothetical protein
MIEEETTEKDSDDEEDEGKPVLDIPNDEGRRLRERERRTARRAMSLGYIPQPPRLTLPLP